MRVEAVHSPLRLAPDRRNQPDAPETEEVDRRDAAQPDRRARHSARSWISAPFAAQLFGQGLIAVVAPERAERAYLQPEARTPLRPTVVKSA